MIRFINYEEGNGSLNTEINNYLFCLNEVCFQNNDVRRYVKSILRLYEKMNSLPVDYSDNSIEEKRTVRKSSRYVSKMKKYFKKVKANDDSVFLKASDLLSGMNNSLTDNFINRYSNESWDSERISRTLLGDISSLVIRKRKESHLFSKNLTEESTDKVETKYYDNFSDQNEKNLPDQINENNGEVLSDTDIVNNSIKKRQLIKKELEELKKEIDYKEDLFINLDSIVVEQRDVIESYINVQKKYEKLSGSFYLIYSDLPSSDVIKLYEKVYDFAGFLISEIFEHIIHLSKISCEINPSTDIYEEKSVISKDVVQIFGKYDIFIAKLQNYLKILNDKHFSKLSDSDKKILSNTLWNKYRLDDISPSSIKVAVSLDLMSFINQNPFTLLQTVVASKRKNESYKKYDLSVILNSVDHSLEKYIPELVSSIETNIMNDRILSFEDKSQIINNIKRCFSSFIGNIHEINEIPLANDYLINYIMCELFNCDGNDLPSMYDKCVSDIYTDEISIYNSLSLFDKLFSGKKKPDIESIKKKIDLFCQEVDKIKEEK